VTTYDATLSDAAEQVTTATWWSIVGNVVLSVVKFVVGHVANSAALVADGFHSLSDVVSSVVVLVGVAIAQKPADEEHPYGHGKAEVVAAKVVSIILLVVGGGTVYQGVVTIRHHVDHMPPGGLAALVAAVSVVVKEGLFQYKIRVGRRTGSQATIADAWHHRSDAFSSVVALAAIGASIIGGPVWSFVDDVGAVAIGAIIAWMGLVLFRASSSELLDCVVRGAPVQQVRRCGETVEGVERIEKVFVRKAGIDLLVDVHVHVDGDLTVREGHRIGHQVRRCVMDAMPAVKSVLVHVEPVDGAAAAAGESEVDRGEG